MKRTKVDPRQEDGEVLELRRDPETLQPYFDAEEKMMFKMKSSGLRYYLNNEGLHAGDILEMHLADGQWQSVCFEWTCQSESSPILFTNEETGFALPEEARYRWPQRNGE